MCTETRIINPNKNYGYSQSNLLLWNVIHYIWSCALFIAVTTLRKLRVVVITSRGKKLVECHVENVTSHVRKNKDLTVPTKCLLRLLVNYIPREHSLVRQ